MITGLTRAAAFAGTCLVVTACGDDKGSTEERRAPPPVVAGEDGDAFALEDGAYYLDDLHELQDGCGKKPMEGSTPITAVPFNLTNNGSGTVTIDFCSYDGSSTQGSVRGNKGVLGAYHSGRKYAAGGQLDQDCHVEFTVTADNVMKGRYTETQRNRNQAVRDATKVDQNECTTSFGFTLERRS